jgi:hypothetical protein
MESTANCRSPQTAATDAVFQAFDPADVVRTDRSLVEPSITIKESRKCGLKRQNQLQYLPFD